MSAPALDMAGIGPIREADAISEQYAALPWRVGRHGGIEILLVTSRQRGRWIVPKGWQATGLSPSRSAAREAFEEAGVIGPIGPDPIGSYRYAKLLEHGRVELRN